ncbi:hypothetical protein ACIRBX_26140 [Kitasatospora sp. NPDC096147]|uniref:hypothetical protein n=1 Tax=Kitasatospora sp. NPDC096147 TaxID=3364093 RepID=UPI00382FAFF1
MARFDLGRPALPRYVAALLATLALLQAILSTSQQDLTTAHPDHCRTVLTASSPPGVPATPDDAGLPHPDLTGADRPGPGQCAVDAHKRGHATPQVRTALSAVTVSVTAAPDRPQTCHRAPDAPRPTLNSLTVLRC